MNMIGMPELIVLAVVSVLWLVPAAAAIWALVTLQRIRSDQRTMQLKLEAIERLLQRG